MVNLFEESIKNAKLAGKLLACTLALKYPFYNHTISLTGFSLGT